MSANISIKNNLITVFGDLTFATVEKLLQQTQSLFAAKTSLIFDLADVKRCDSAGMALLLEWYKRAKKNNVAIFFKNPVQQLRQMIKVCELETIFDSLN